ncbi:unnamed protein product [Paramecium pentaurelia]|uniref:Uncharacterized protein n=1 Tax=Paramecium pentaurelia TaxID=43138 RepID=A0A8S1VYB7_9CILI|nr:unnamed protein product [Paramecium pentaurelia]
MNAFKQSLNILSTVQLQFYFRLRYYNQLPFFLKFPLQQLRQYDIHQKSIISNIKQLFLLKQLVLISKYPTLFIMMINSIFEVKLNEGFGSFFVENFEIKFCNFQQSIGFQDGAIYIQAQRNSIISISQFQFKNIVTLFYKYLGYMNLFIQMQLKQKLSSYHSLIDYQKYYWQGRWRINLNKIRFSYYSEINFSIGNQKYLFQTWIFHIQFNFQCGFKIANNEIRFNFQSKYFRKIEELFKLIQL